MPLEDNAYGLRDVQRTLLDIMLEIDRVCRAHHIDYTLLGGTMLGAVREQGFIPWDDDLDIAFRREERERFLDVFPKESERYTITLTDTWVARAVPRQTTDDEKPFVDLFHFVPISASPFKQKCKVLALKALQGMLKDGVSLDSYPRAYRALLWGTHALGLLFSKEQKLRWYGHVSENWAKGDGSLTHIPDESFRALHILYPAEWTKAALDMPFEGIPLRVSAHYDGMLTKQYGDYRTPPPESQRAATHEAQRRHDGAAPYPSKQ